MTVAEKNDNIQVQQMETRCLKKVQIKCVCLICIPGKLESDFAS